MLKVQQENQEVVVVNLALKEEEALANFFKYFKSLFLDLGNFF